MASSAKRARYDDEPCFDPKLKELIEVHRIKFPKRFEYFDNQLMAYYNVNKQVRHFFSYTLLYVFLL